MQNSMHFYWVSIVNYLVEIYVHTFLKKIYLFLAVLAFHCSMCFSLVAASGGCSLVALLKLLIAVVSLVAEHGLLGFWGSVVMALGP